MQEKQILFDGFQIIQDDRFLKLTQDTALLSDFVKLKKNQKIFDLGVGIGSLSLLLLVKNSEIFIDGIEISPDAAQIARENYKINGFENRAAVRTGDLKELRDNGKDKFDVCVSNPPYFGTNKGKTAKSEGVATGRSELSADIFDVVKCARAMLNWGGRLFFCYKPERIESAFKALFEYNFAVKRMTFVCQRVDVAPNLVLIEAIYGGKEWCDITCPIYIEK